MVLKVSIYDKDKRRKHTWWDNFYHSGLMVSRMTPYVPNGFVIPELDEYNAKWLGNDQIEFETEEDYVMFVLRWS